MKVEVTLEALDVHWVDEHAECSLRELAEASQLSEPELRELVELGVLEPIGGVAVRGAGEARFAARCLVTLQSVRRLRADFELDPQGVSVALALLEKIEHLERQLRALRAQLPSPPG